MVRRSAYRFIFLISSSLLGRSISSPSFNCEQKANVDAAAFFVWAQFVTAFFVLAFPPWKLRCLQLMDRVRTRAFPAERFV